MKYNEEELDVDFIGGQEPLTKEEEIAISAFISSQKKSGETFTKSEIEHPRSVQTAIRIKDPLP